MSEELVFVPLSVAENTIGFSIDSGGSATKIVYRPKDATHIKSVPEGMGALLLATFNTSEVDAVVDFLAEKCDLSGDRAGRKVYSTGVGVHKLVSKLRETFNLELQIEVEFHLFVRSFRYLFSTFPWHSLVYEPHAQGMVEAEEYLRPWQEYGGAQSKHSDYGFGSNEHQEQTEMTDLETTEMLPCLLAQMGSACVLYKIASDWSVGVVDLCHTGGRAVCGVASAICGESMTFDELMTLANTGRTREVDIHARELKSEDSSGLYQAVPDDIVSFAYGKVTEKHPSKYTVSY